MNATDSKKVASRSIFVMNESDTQLADAWKMPATVAQVFAEKMQRAKETLNGRILKAQEAFPYRGCFAVHNRRRVYCSRGARRIFAALEGSSAALGTRGTCGGDPGGVRGSLTGLDTAGAAAQCRPAGNHLPA